MATSHRNSPGDGDQVLTGVPLYGCFLRKCFEIGADHVQLESCPLNGQASRALSTARLKRSRALHLPPINVVVSHGPLGGLNPQGGFIFGGASHLDAFSGYPFPT